MSLKERAIEEIKVKSNQLSKQYLDDMKAYYMQHRKSVVDLPSAHPNAFIALTYVLTFVAGGFII